MVTPTKEKTGVPQAKIWKVGTPVLPALNLPKMNKRGVLTKTTA